MTNDHPQRKVSPHQQQKFQRRILSPASLQPSLGARRLHVGSFALSLVATTYIVFYADFGENHCFMPIRNWLTEKRKQFWSLSSKEEQELREQGRIK
ncbi:uncharacterized protein VTP21DRAFT_10565 [Calcarisporiella thermophila]|uniref:uncharacterized protein n=1 Tax=Calcarisporiella thermophila TaxID=911321 RepID=UPI00374235E2